MLNAADVMQYPSCTPLLRRVQFHRDCPPLQSGLGDDLEPHLKKFGCMDLMDKFLNGFDGTKILKGTKIPFLWNPGKLQ